jgi:hypothetical protein
MSGITCPSCQQHLEPAVRVANLAICGGCGVSVVVELNGTVRRATAQDTTVLAPSDRAQLTSARARLARGERRPS